MSRKPLEGRCVPREWIGFVEEIMRVAREGSVNVVQKRRRERGDDLDHKFRRALQLVQEARYEGYLSTTSRKLKMSGSRNSKVIREMMMKERK